MIGTVRGREPGYIVVGAHYDTKDIPGFVGANDGASGTAVVAAARAHASGARGTRSSSSSSTARRRRAASPDSEFERSGCAAARSLRPRSDDARAMVLLDFVGDKQPRDQARGVLERAPLEAAAGGGEARGRRGACSRPRHQGASLDDHIPFLREGCPSIDLIDFDFPCWHRTCDDLSARVRAQRRCGRRDDATSSSAEL